MRTRFREHDEFVPVGVEFMRQLQWRFLLVLAFFGMDLAFLLAGAGVSSRTVVLAYLPYLVLVGAVWLAGRARLLADVPSLPLVVAAFMADLTLVAVQLHLSGGGWWHGASFYMLAVVIAASIVPPRALVLVTVAAISLFAGVSWLEVSGVLPPPVWGNFPRVDGNMSFLLNYVVFGALTLSGAAFIQWRLMARTRRVQLRHRAVLDASPYLVLTLDPHDLITSASQIAETITGRAVADLLGTDFASLLDASEQASVADLLARARAGERFRRELRGAATGADGRSRWYGAGFSRVDSGDPRDSVFVILRDMTVERARQEENAQLAHQLEEARRLELVGRLVSGVAHELNNPLAAILALTEQLGHEPRDQVLADARVIHEQARRARSIVRDLLQVVRGPAPLTLTAADARDLVERSVAGLATRPERAHIDLHVELPNAACPVNVEDGSIEQVLTNLVVNALQATPTGGRIDVAVRQDASLIEIEVRDDGPGFTDAVRARLFEPFFTTRPPGHGTGLGLAVSRAIVERHGGTLEASSAQPGARLLVRLPRHAAEATRPATGIATPPVSMRGVPRAKGTAPGARRVLLIDDEAAIRLALARWFERQGWHVTHCTDGARALSLLLGAREVFDLVISDLKMPGLSGIDVYAALRDGRPEILERLIIATGDVASPDVATFLATVSGPVLEKPFALAQLASVVETMVPRAA